MGIISSRDPDKGIIEGRFINYVLNDQAQSINIDVKAEMRRRGFSDPKWNRNEITVNDNYLSYTTIAATRFVDMKTRFVKHGYSRGTRKVPPGKKRKKEIPVHNKILWRHKKFILRTLSFGFSDAVKDTMRELAEEEGLIMTKK